MCIIEAKNIFKYYWKVPTLKDISINISKGEILGIMGLKGSGKSTLVKCLLGEEKITIGSITVLNSKIPNLKVLDNIGYMPQYNQLYNELTGRENLYFFGRVFNLKGTFLDERVEYVTSILELEDLDVVVANYSNEMKQRLSFAISLVHNPDILILDEPTSAFNSSFHQIMWQELERLNSFGKTIILVSNSASDLSKCHRLMLLNEGEILTMGNLTDITKNYVNLVSQVIL